MKHHYTYNDEEYNVSASSLPIYWWGVECFITTHIMMRSRVFHYYTFIDKQYNVNVPSFHIWIIPCQIIQYFWMLTPITQILFIFSLFVDKVEIIKPWNFSPQLLTVPNLLRFEHLTKMGVPWLNPLFWIYVFCNNYCSSHPFMLKFGFGKFFGNEKSKNHTWKT